MTTTTVKTHTLQAGDVTSLADVPQLVFGHLAGMVAPVIKSYHSDLFWDAEWIRAHMTGNSVTFFFSFNESGTSIFFHPYDTHRRYSYLVTATVLDDVASIKVEPFKQSTTDG